MCIFPVCISTKRNNFFFRGVLREHSSSRSPREGVDTCRDRALNASGRGYYGQAKSWQDSKGDSLGHKYLRNKLSHRDVSSCRFFL